MKFQTNHKAVEKHTRDLSSGHRGFTLVELLIGIAIMAFGMLGIASLFFVGYRAVSDSGRTTMTLTASQQILEDIRSIPFANLPNLNGFDTTVSTTIPASGPEREVARRWRYALAGEGGGFTYTTAEKAQWASLSTSVASPNSSTGTTAAFGAKGTISVVDQSTSLRLVTIVITVANLSKPSQTKTVSLATLVCRM